MANEVDRSSSDPHTELMREVVRTVRAERRLIEHELTRRRVLLALTVALPVAGVALAAAGDPYVGGAFVGGGMVSGAAAVPGRFVRRD
jgi:hypothetical protein